MDPNKALDNIRAIVAEMRQAHTETELLELGDELSWIVTDLDQWLTAGGFPPQAWNTTVAHTA